MTDIVKVQVPLIANDPAEVALVYAKGRKYAGAHEETGTKGLSV